MKSKYYQEGYAQAKYDYETKGFDILLFFYEEYMNSDPTDYLSDEKEEIVGYCDGFRDIVNERNIDFWINV